MHDHPKNTPSIETLGRLRARAEARRRTGLYRAAITVAIAVDCRGAARPSRYCVSARSGRDPWRDGCRLASVTCGMYDLMSADPHSHSQCCNRFPRVIGLRHLPSAGVSAVHLDDAQCWHLSLARTHPAETMCDHAAVAAFEATRPCRASGKVDTGFFRETRNKAGSSTTLQPFRCFSRRRRPFTHTGGDGPAPVN